MNMKELAQAFHHARLRLSEQENNLFLVHKLVKDLSDDEQTFDLQLEIKGLNKEIKTQDTLIEQRKAEIEVFQSAILALLKEGNPEKSTVYIDEENYVELSKNADGTLSFKGPFPKAG
jgi:hypothetical protein